MSNHHTVEITDANWEAEVTQSERPVLVDFWAEWCAPCRAIAPLLEEIAAEQKGLLTVGKFDIESNTFGERYQIFSIPTLILFVKGQEVERIVGALPKEKIMERVRRHLPVPVAG